MGGEGCVLAVGMYRSPPANLLRRMWLEVRRAAGSVSEAEGQDGDHDFADVVNAGDN